MSLSTFAASKTGLPSKKWGIPEEMTVILNMSGKNLGSLETILPFQNLIELDLSLNRLSEEMAPSFICFKYLKKLSLANNCYKSVPKVPPGIEVLSVAGNWLSEIPEDIKDLSSLTRVDFSENSINSLEPICKCPSIRILLAHTNSVESPSFLSKMPSLVEVDLSFNKIETLGEISAILSGTCMSNLKILNLSGNPCIKSHESMQFDELVSSDQSYFSPFHSTRSKDNGILVREKQSVKKSMVFKSIGSEAKHRSHSLFSHKSMISTKKEPDSSFHSSSCSDSTSKDLNTSPIETSERINIEIPMDFVSSDQQDTPIKTAPCSKPAAFVNACNFQSARSQSKGTEPIKIMSLEPIYISEGKDSAKSKEIKKVTTTTNEGDSITNGRLENKLKEQKNEKKKRKLESQMVSEAQIKKAKELLGNSIQTIEKKMTKDQLIEALFDYIKTKNKVIENALKNEVDMRGNHQKVDSTKNKSSFFPYYASSRIINHQKCKSQSFFSSDILPKHITPTIGRHKMAKKGFQSSANLTHDYLKSSMDCPNPPPSLKKKSQPDAIAINSFLKISETPSQVLFCDQKYPTSQSLYGSSRNSTKNLNFFGSNHGKINFFREFEPAKFVQVSQRNPIANSTTRKRKGTPKFDSSFPKNNFTGQQDSNLVRKLGSSKNSSHVSNKKGNSSFQREKSKPKKSKLLTSNRNSFNSSFLSSSSQTFWKEGTKGFKSSSVILQRSPPKTEGLSIEKREAFFNGSFLKTFSIEATNGQMVSIDMKNEALKRKKTQPQVKSHRPHMKGVDLKIPNGLHEKSFKRKKDRSTANF